jgi:hypothetical protein
MHTITVYLAESEKRKRKRSKWAIPILIGLVAAFAFGRPNARIEEPVPIVVTPAVEAPVVVTPVAEAPVAEVPVFDTPAVEEPPVPPPALPAHAVVTPARLDFGDGPMDRGVAPQLATLRNDGGQPIARITTAVDGPFIATNGCARGLAPGGECIVAVTFTTQQPGKFTGALTIATDTKRSRVPLRGSVARPRVIVSDPVPAPATTPAVAQAPTPVVPAPPPIPKRKLCADPPRLVFTQVGKQTITLTNRETTPLRVMGVDIVGKTGQSASGYEIDSGKCMRVLKPGQRCRFTVRATDLAIQRKETITLDVYYDDPITGQRRVASVINCASR